MALKVSVVTPEGGTAWEGDADEVIIPAVTGEIGILPGRQPVLAALGNGEIRVKNSGEVLYKRRVTDGIASVDSDNVTIVIDEIEESLVSAR
ncbi:MAG: hypothetical protein Q4A71_06035 [Actinomycetaceae bacterium]|nr:hypothetical protein [Actinomycetaceae bacterium]